MVVKLVGWALLKAVAPDPVTVSVPALKVMFFVPVAVANVPVE